jgi:proteasome activator subunit 4
MYRAAEITPDWRIPSDRDIDMALEIYDLADECNTKIRGLLEKRSVGDTEWSNEFCRAINVIDKVLRGSYNLIAEIQASKVGGKVSET